MKPLKVAIIAGEASGDHLGADLVAALKRLVTEQDDRQVELVGIGGPGLKTQGLKSLFDYSELSLMGVTAILARLPKLIKRIRETANVIVAENPDVLIIIDSPDFTHRVAKVVRRKKPDIPIINYVCPTVWAWKPKRAQKMRGYVDHILSVFPFEKEAVEKLEGPPLTYIGHRLVENGGLKTARTWQLSHTLTEKKQFLLLPGSRNSEIKNLLEPLKEAAIELAEQFPEARFMIPTIPNKEQILIEKTKDWPVIVSVLSGEAAKWHCFAKADAAIAASGTILLELALARVPCISIYKTDFFIRMMMNRINLWSAALPNIIIGYPAITEYLDGMVRGRALAKRTARLAIPSLERQAVIEAFDEVHENMQVSEKPSSAGAKIVLSYLNRATQNDDDAKEKGA